MSDGVYVEKPAMVLEYEVIFLGSNYQWQESPGTPASRKFNVVRQFPRIADRHLHEPCQDIVDEALESGDRQKMLAALDWAMLRNRYLDWLMGVEGVGLKFEMALEIQIGLHQQTRLDCAINGEKETWLN